MIVDDLAAVTPLAHETLRDVHVLRVPWHLWPEERTGFTWSEREWGIAHKLVPHDTDDATQKEAISWKDLHLPYNQLLITSTSADPCVWFVEEFPTTGGFPYIGVTVFIRLLSGLWIPFPMIFTKTPNGLLGFPSWRSLITNNRAKLFTYVGRSLLMVGNSPQPRAFADYMDKLADHTDQVTEKGLTLDRDNVAIMLTATVALLSCKNVVQEPVVPEPKLQRARIQRGHLPLYRYHVLKVHMTGATPHTGHAQDGGVSTALHWVRGHFKRYGPGNKLFGKHEGLYWWQPHIAGTAPRIVDKDYELVT